MTSMLKVGITYVLINVFESKELNSGGIKFLCCFITAYPQIYKIK